MAEENTPEVTEQGGTPTEPAPDEPKTFSQEYVSELRNEAKGHRETSKALATRLHSELVRASGRLADPNDLPFDQAHIDNPDALNTAIDELLTRKPHFASRRPNGAVGQGVKDSGTPPGSIIAHLKTLV